MNTEMIQVWTEWFRIKGLSQKVYAIEPPKPAPVLVMPRQFLKAA